MREATARVSAGEIERQRQLCQTIRERLLSRREGTPLAHIETYGCQQNVADSQRLMGMLEAMGCAFTENAHEIGRAHV